MSTITPDQIARFEQTLQRMEQSAETHRLFLNLPIGFNVSTEAGDVKSLATLANDVQLLGAEIGEFVVEVADHLDQLAVV